MATWPPVLDDLKLDMKIDDDRDDDALQVVLDAAISFVYDKRGEDFNFDEESGSDLPDPTDTIVLGTLRLARRWDERRKSPDGTVNLGDLGSGRVPSVDPDIERMLGLGRWRGPVIA